MPGRWGRPREGEAPQALRGWALRETPQELFQDDAGTGGIGIGAGQVNSALCTTNTIVSGADYNLYLFADRVYPTPAAQRKFGDYAFQRIRARW